jgi:hypothetical protein
MGGFTAIRPLTLEFPFNELSERPLARRIPLAALIRLLILLQVHRTKEVVRRHVSQRSTVM